jgi:hypothetical protein
VRLTEEQPKSQLVTMVQRAQNKMLRVLDGARIVDRKSTKNLLEEQNILSVNHMAAQIKFERWRNKDKETVKPVQEKSKVTKSNGLKNLAENNPDVERTLTDIFKAFNGE